MFVGVVDGDIGRLEDPISVSEGVISISRALGASSICSGADSGGG